MFIGMYQIGLLTLNTNDHLFKEWIDRRHFQVSNDYWSEFRSVTPCPLRKLWQTDQPTNQPTDRPSNAPTDQQTDTWGFIVNSYTSIRYKHLTLRTWNMDRSLVSTRIKVKKERRKKEKMEGKMEWRKKLGRTYIYQQNEKYKTHNANNAYCLEFVMTVF